MKGQSLDLYSIVLNSLYVHFWLCVMILRCFLSVTFRPIYHPSIIHLLFEAMNQPMNLRNTHNKIHSVSYACIGWPEPWGVLCRANCFSFLLSLCAVTVHQYVLAIRGAREHFVESTWLVEFLSFFFFIFFINRKFY